MLPAAYFPVVLVTLALMCGCVLLHYEALAVLSRLLVRLHGWRRRRILLQIFCVLALHIIEIWIFALGYHLLEHRPDYGELRGLYPLGVLDEVYFSAVVYTTLGLGDIVPFGAIRFLVGTEALLGFVLLTWSASFTYLEMQRFWRGR